MPPLCTKDRNVNCGLGRNVDPLAILLPLFGFEREMTTAKAMDSLTGSGVLRRYRELAQLFGPSVALCKSLITAMISFHLCTKKKLCVIIHSGTHCNTDD